MIISFYQLKNEQIMFQNQFKRYFSYFYEYFTFYNIYVNFFILNLIKMDLSQFQKIKVLGQGTFGKCYLANDKKTNQLCVIKQIDVNGMSDKQKHDTLREARILQALDHPSIIKFIGTFNTKGGYINIVMAYADGGDMGKKITQAKGIYFDENRILNWFTQICLAIKHVHDRKIIHRDLKCQNIFLTKEGIIKLGDFGIAKALKQTIQKIKSVVGTPYYMSPQICDNKDYSFKTDIWSLGVILYQICALRPPFQSNSLAGLALRITRGQYNPLPPIFSKQLKKLVNELLTVDPAKRPTILQVLKTPIIQSRIVNYFKQNNEPLSDNKVNSNYNNSKQMNYQKSQIESMKKKIGNLMSPSAIYNPLFPVQTPQYKCVDINSKLKQNVSSQKDKNSNNYDWNNNTNKKIKQKQIRKRQISQPNLTPKIFNKNQQTQRPGYQAEKSHRLRQNISQVNLDKKKVEKLIHQEKKVYKMKKKQQRYEQGKIIERKSIDEILGEMKEIKCQIEMDKNQFKIKEQKICELNNRNLKLNGISKCLKLYNVQELQQIILDEPNSKRKRSKQMQLQMNKSINEVMKKYEGKQQEIQFSYQTQLDSLKYMLEQKLGIQKLNKSLCLIRKECGYVWDLEKIDFLNPQQKKYIPLIIMLNQIKIT